MNANEIAAKVQDGQADYLQLWEAVQRFAWKQAIRWARALEWRGGATAEDLLQCAFLALLDALEGWDAAGGSFIGWYALKLKAAFTEATGQRTKREQLDPLQSACSLDEPLTNGEEDFSTLGDTIPDPAAELAVEAVAELDFQQRRRKALEKALARLPEAQRTAVVGRYCYGKKTDIRLCNAGLRALRHPSISRELKQYV